MNNRKPRIQGKLDNLPSKQREHVHEWFRQKLTYAQIAERIKQRFGIKIAPSSLCTYYARKNQEIFGGSGVSDVRGSAPAILQIQIGPQIEIGAVLVNRKSGAQIVQIFGREKPVPDRQGEPKADERA